MNPRQAATQTIRAVQGALMRFVWPVLDLVVAVCDAATSATHSEDRMGRFRAIIEQDHAELAFADDPDEPRIPTPRVRIVQVGPRLWQWHMSLSIPLHPDFGEFAGIAGIQQVVCREGTAPSRRLALRQGDFYAGVTLAPIVTVIEAMNQGGDQ